MIKARNKKYKEQDAEEFDGNSSMELQIEECKTIKQSRYKLLPVARQCNIRFEQLWRSCPACNGADVKKSDPAIIVWNNLSPSISNLY